MVSLVYHGILPWSTMIYHGLPVSKHHGIFSKGMFAPLGDIS